MVDRFLSYDDLKKRKGIYYSKSHLRRLERAGRFPNRIKLSPLVVAWHESEIDEYLVAKLEERKKVAATKR